MGLMNRKEQERGEGRGERGEGRGEGEQVPLRVECCATEPSRGREERFYFPSGTFGCSSEWFSFLLFFY